MRWESSKPWDLALALALLLALDALVLLDAGGPLRVVLGVAAILLVPGHLLVSALFPSRHRVVSLLAGEPGEEETRRTEESLDVLERLALALGLSIAVVPLLGLALNASPWGVRVEPLLAGLTVLCLALAAVAAWRRARTAPERRFLLRVELHAPRWSASPAPEKAIVLGLVASLVVGGALLAYALAAPRPPETFTELYVLGPDGRAEGYPTQLSSGEEGRVRMGVVNREGRAVEYAARVVAEPGRVVNASDGAGFEPAGATVLSSWNLTLEAGARWEEEVAFSLPAPGLYRVRFEVDVPGAESPYRRAHLFVDVTR